MTSPQGPTYKYSDEAIISGIEAIRKAHNNIDTALDQLEAYAQGQLADWDGETRNLYNNAKNDWNNSVDQMKNIMVNGAIPALRNILENYNNTERLNQGSWQQG